MDPFSAILTLGSKIVSSLGAAGAGAGAGAGAAGAAKGAKLAQMLANIQTGTEIGKTAKQFLAEPPSAPIATGRGGVNYGNEVDRLRNKGLL
jgi:hypothetical protein